MQRCRIKKQGAKNVTETNKTSNHKYNYKKNNNNYINETGGLGWMDGWMEIYINDGRLDVYMYTLMKD